MTQIPGWYPDPAGGGGQRWWNGYRWTEHQQAAPAVAAGPVAQAGEKRVWLRVLIVLGVLLLLFVGGCAALLSAGSKAINDSTDQMKADQKLRNEEIAKEVVLDSCGKDRFGDVQATGTLTNGSSERSNYSITVAYLNAAGLKVNDGTAGVDHVAPGQRAVWEAASFEKYQDGMTCTVVDVSRHSDE